MNGHSQTQQDAQAKKRREVQARTQLRENYRDLQGEAADNETNRATVSVGRLTNLVQRTGEQFIEVQRPQEANLDSKVLIATSGTGAALARNMHSAQLAFNRLEFADKVAALLRSKRARAMDDDDEHDGTISADWSVLGYKGAAYSRRACLPSFALGPLAIEHKVRTANAGNRARFDKTKMIKTRPEEMNLTATEGNKDQTLAAAINLEDLLMAKPIDGKFVNFYEFIINPFSYSQTIENLFYLSFGISKSRIALNVDEDTGSLIIMATSPASAVEAGEFNMSKMQLMMEMDLDIYREAIETHDIRRCLHIPNRPTLFH